MAISKLDHLLDGTGLGIGDLNTLACALLHIGRMISSSIPFDSLTVPCQLLHMYLLLTYSFSLYSPLLPLAFPVLRVLFSFLSRINVFELNDSPEHSLQLISEQTNRTCKQACLQAAASKTLSLFCRCLHPSGFFLTYKTRSQEGRIVVEKPSSARRIVKGDAAQSRCGDYGNDEDHGQTCEVGRPIFIQCQYWEELRSLYEGAEPQPNTG